MAEKLQFTGTQHSAATSTTMATTDAVSQCDVLPKTFITSSAGVIHDVVRTFIQMIILYCFQNKNLLLLLIVFQTDMALYHNEHIGIWQVHMYICHK